MANLIQLKRGVQASLPTLNDGEPGWCTDTFRLYIGQGSANKLIGEADFLKLIGGTLTGALVLSGDPTLALHPATKQYVDTDFLKLVGGTLTGALTLNADPTNDLHAATKQYVDALASGLDLKASCRVATAAALPAYTRTGNVITASANGALAAVDGVTLVLNDRLLLKDGTAGADNGIYYVSQVGDAGTPYTLTRVTDADTDAEVNAGLFTFIEEGTVNGDKGFVLTTNNPITVNTTSLAFSQFSGAGDVVAGSGMTKTGNTLNVIGGTGITANADDIEVDYGTTGTTACVGNDGRLHSQNTDVGTDSTFFTLATYGKLLSAAATSLKTWTFPNLTGGVLLDVSPIDGGSF